MRWREDALEGSYATAQLLDAVIEGGEGAAFGQGRHGNGLSSVVAVRKRPISASHTERELPKRAMSWLASRAKRSQRNCTIARKFRSHTPRLNAIMKRSMNRPRIQTSRVVGLSSGTFVSMDASIVISPVGYYGSGEQTIRESRNCC